MALLFQKESVRKLRRFLPDIIQGTLIAFFAFFAGAYIYAVASADLCLDVHLGSNSCGQISSPVVMQEAIARLNQQAAASGNPVSIDVSYTFSRQSSELLDEDDCYALLVSYTELYFTDAYAISAGGGDTIYLSSQKDAEEVYSRFEVAFCQAVLENEEDAKQISLSDTLKIEQTVCSRSLISTAEEAYNRLCTYLPGEKELPEAEEENAEDNENPASRVSAFSNDSTYTYRSYYDFDLARNETVGTLITEEISSKMSELTLSYRLYKEVTESVLIPHETEIIYDETQYVGTDTVKTVGEDGVASAVYEVEYLAGLETSRTLLSMTTVSEAVTEVIVKGTKAYPKPVPTGTYIWPLDLENNIVTSRFGWRSDPFNGTKRYHKGIDIYAPKGSAVYASDGGEVVHASYDSSFGLLIIVDHGNGLQTYYSHLNDILVEVGDNVYQGQLIGKVGKTGRATGYHLHFGVYLNGKEKNPEKYLPKGIACYY